MIRYVLLCLLPLAACAGPATCRLQHLADVPLTLRDGLLTLPAKINNQPVTMLLDTAAAGTTLTPATVAALDLRPNHYSTGKFATHTFDVGGQTEWDWPYRVWDLTPGRTESGVIGPDWLQHFDVEIDLSRQRMAFYEAKDCSEHYIPWAEPYETHQHTTDGSLLIFSLRLIDLASGRPMAKKTADGVILAIPKPMRDHLVTAQIDTDIDKLMISRPAYDRVEAEAGYLTAPASDSQHPGNIVLGTDPPPSSAHILSNPIDVHKADVFLGTEYLQTHRVWLSYGTHQVFIQPSTPRG